jgi:outer membrane protein assembly factor BamD (BamD/ComL family)
MLRRLPIFALLLLGAVWFPYPSPAPFVYRPGVGWIYEPVGSEGSWLRERAEDQLNVAKEAMERGSYKTVVRATRRLIRDFPQSDYAPEATYLLAQAYEKRDRGEQAFRTYQTLLTKYPKYGNFDRALERQFDIANQYYNGRWFKLWNIIPLYPSKDKTAELYKQIVSVAPYHPIGAKSQMQIGSVREAQKDYPEAVSTFLSAADRYYDRPEVAADALFRAGKALHAQAQRAEYDQGAAGEAIDTFTDFIALYPDDKRVAEAETTIDELRTEQARGALQIAQYYDKRRRVAAALIYYNEVIVKDANSGYAQDAKERIARIKGEPPASPPTPPAVPN